MNILAKIWHIKNSLFMRCSTRCKLLKTPLRICENHLKSVWKWILKMLPRTVTNCNNFQILICSPLQIRSPHLLSKFHGYIFNDLGEKWLWKLPPEILSVDKKKSGEHRLFIEGWLKVVDKCRHFCKASLSEWLLVSLLSLFHLSLHELAIIL